MPHCFNGGRTQPTTLQRTFQPITPVRAAVCVALYGMWPAAHAQQTPAAQEAAVAALQEVTVTATRRQQTLEAVPYSMSVVSADLDELKTINDDVQKERRELMQDAQGNFQAIMPKMQALTKESNTKAADTLTEDQKKQWKEMVGKPFEVKMEQRRRDT